MPSTLRVTAALIATVLFFAACGDGDTINTSDTIDTSDETSDNAADQTTDEGLPATVDPEELVGATWTMWAGGGSDGEIPLVDDWPITIVFQDKTFGGTAACNGYGGTYRLDGTALTLSEPDRTEMGCGSEVQASERAFLAALVDVDGLNLSADELALSGPSTELIFAREPPLPATELTGQEWLLETLIEGDTESTVAGERATLMLSADGSLAGGTGCRGFSGSYVVNGNQVIFTDFAMDGRECPAELSAQDSTVVGVLGDGFTVEIDGDRLTIISAGGFGLSYRASVDG